MPLAHNRVYNNIFVSAAKHNEGALAALQLANSEQTWVTDNILDRNCYWNTDPAAVPDFQSVLANPVTHDQENTPGYMQFAQWQSSFAVAYGGTHTAQDLNSIIANPQFVSSTLVPGPDSPVLLKGLHLAEVMDDFNGALRPLAPFFPYALGAFQPPVPETVVSGTPDGLLTFRPGPIRKKTDQSITSDNTLNDDSTLKFTMAPNAKYNIRLKVFFSTTATADFKYRVTGPSATLVRRQITRQAGTAPGIITPTFGFGTTYSTSDIVMDGTGTDGFIDEEIIVHNGATAGDFVFRWSQNTSSAGATIVRAGSYIEYTPF
jgi:hypothetical protein